MAWITQSGEPSVQRQHLRCHDRRRRKWLRFEGLEQRRLLAAHFFGSQMRSVCFPLNAATEAPAPQTGYVQPSSMGPFQAYAQASPLSRVLNSNGSGSHFHLTDVGSGETSELEEMPMELATEVVVTQSVPPDQVESGGSAAELNSVNGVVFSHLLEGSGYGAFAASSGFLGQEDYDSINDANINLTGITFAGSLDVAGDIRFDFYDASNSVLQASVTATLPGAPGAFYTVSIPQGVTIPDQGVLELTALNGVNARWFGSDAAPLVGSESSSFGTLEFAGLSHNFELTNSSTDPDDFGDAPTPYPTLAADNGAMHTISSLLLGELVDGESEGQPDPLAMGDDDFGNDEDGVVFNGYFDRETAVEISVTASESGGVLNAWIDWNQNGSWQDSGEQIFVNTALAAGANLLTINVPAGAELGRTFARFRLSTTSDLAPTGAAPDGEVEDHPILVEDGGRRIIWSNRAQASDRFEETFGGASVNIARGVVDAVMRSWERAITDFNQPGGGDQIAVDISMKSGGSGDFGAGATITSFNNGYPTAGIVTIGRGNDTNGDGVGDGAGYFLDPTPMDWAEFAGSVVGGAFVPYAQAGSPAFGMSDLFTLVNAEITHVLGLFLSPALINNPANGSVTDTNILDISEGGGVGEYYVFDGPSVTHLMTSNNGGSSGNDLGEIVHTAGPDDGSANQPVAFTSATRGALQLVGADGPGNAVYESGRRYLVNDVMALLFKDAYNYSVTLPQVFGTSYALFDEATGELLIRGGSGGSEDEISISVDGTDILVSANIGDDVAGTGPRGDSSDLAAFVSRFPVSAVSTITIQGGDGSDLISLSPLEGIPVSIDGGAPAFPNGGVGDALSFDVSGVSGVNFVDNGDGTGNLSSTSHGTISWTEIEEVTAPYPVLEIVATDAAKAEGDLGVTPFTFTVTRSGDTSGATTVDWLVVGSGDNPADTADFGGSLPSGTISFDENETTEVVTVDVSGDIAFEADEEFTVSLTNASGDAVVVAASAIGTIENDDFVAGRHIFYNSSVFDGNGSLIDTDPAGGYDESASIATDKTALLPGGTATFANYTSYLRGINGIMVDVADVAGTVTAADFEFRVGNDNAPDAWSPAPAPSEVQTLVDAGEGGTDRIVITWADGDIAKSWLQVTIKANANTGLVSDDVHYWGNWLAEVGNSSTNTAVNISDALEVLNNPTDSTNPAAVESRYDFNRDGAVNITDALLALNNPTDSTNYLELISPPLTGVAPNSMEVTLTSELVDYVLSESDEDALLLGRSRDALRSPLPTRLGLDPRLALQRLR